MPRVLRAWMVQDNVDGVLDYGFCCVQDRCTRLYQAFLEESIIDYRPYDIKK